MGIWSLICVVVLLALPNSPIEPHMTAPEQTIPVEDFDRKNRLKVLCGSLQNYAHSKCEVDYVAHLRTSCAALEEYPDGNQKFWDLPSDTHNLLQKYYEDCEIHFDGMNRALVEGVGASASDADRTGLNTNQSFRLSPSFWLAQLHRDRFEALPEPWKAIIVKYALAITQLHRARRLVTLSTKPVDLAEELKHVGHSNWKPLEHPEVLLLEAESGIMIREEQALIAGHMISPLNGTNAVLQLQMGQGKSTVLTPVVATALTDKKM